MNSKIKLALVAGLAFAGLGFAAQSASAMPTQGLDNGVAHASDLQKGLTDVRYICGYWGCRWVPGPYWGWHHYHHWHGGYGWHRWHHW
ncbi:MAG: hypothetical protein ACLP8A_08240 [Methylovirgula sp.]